MLGYGSTSTVHMVHDKTEEYVEKRIINISLQDLATEVLYQDLASGIGVSVPVIDSYWIKDSKTGVIIMPKLEKTLIQIFKDPMTSNNRIIKLLIEFVKLKLRLFDIKIDHGDINLDNGMIDKNGRLYLIDFGLSVESKGYNVKYILGDLERELMFVPNMTKERAERIMESVYDYFDVTIPSEKINPITI